MKKALLRVTMVTGSVVALLLVCAIAVSAGGTGFNYGGSSDGAGPGLENQWGKNAMTGYGQSSDCTGPDLMNQWGKKAVAGYGQSSDCIGPDLMNQWGNKAQS